MRIVHICIANPYVDNWGYQENILPEYLHKEGAENHIVTSNSVLPNYLNAVEKKEIIAKGNVYTLGNVIIHKIKSKRISSTMYVTTGLYNLLKELSPDIILHHGIGPTTLPIVSKYARKFNCRLYADNHADELNMNKNKLWILLYYKCCSRIACKIRLGAYTKFFGVTNSRCDFLNRYFGVPKDKIELLPIGADVDMADKLENVDIIRRKYGFAENDMIVTSGGKMGKGKGTDSLIKAVEVLREENSNIRLVLFGKFEDDETKEMAEEKSFVTIYGWCDRIRTLEILKLSDLACWPVHHTTLMEDAISVETPIITRKTGTTSHLINGNGLWIEHELLSAIREFVQHWLPQKNVLKLACQKKREEISYSTIAKRILCN